MKSSNHVFCSFVAKAKGSNIMTLRVCLRARRPTWKGFARCRFFRRSRRCVQLFWFLSVTCLIFTSQFPIHVVCECFFSRSLLLFTVSQEICMCNPFFVPFQNSGEQKSEPCPLKTRWNNSSSFFRLKLPSLIYFCFSVFNNENEHFTRVADARERPGECREKKHTPLLQLTKFKVSDTKWTKL